MGLDWRIEEKEAGGGRWYAYQRTTGIILVTVVNRQTFLGSRVVQS
jgi:hypothetical protein